MVPRGRSRARRHIGEQPEDELHPDPRERARLAKPGLVGSQDRLEAVEHAGRQRGEKAEGRGARQLADEHKGAGLELCRERESRTRQRRARPCTHHLAQGCKIAHGQQAWRELVMELVSNAAARTLTAE